MEILQYKYLTIVHKYGTWINVLTVLFSATVSDYSSKINLMSCTRSENSCSLCSLRPQFISSVSVSLKYLLFRTVWGVCWLPGTVINTMAVQSGTVRYRKNPLQLSIIVDRQVFRQVRPVPIDAGFISKQRICSRYYHQTINWTHREKISAYLWKALTQCTLILTQPK